MTKTIMILAIAAAFVAGSIGTGTIAFAGDDDDDDDDGQNIFGIIIQKLDQIIAAIGGIDTSGLL